MKRTDLLIRVLLYLFAVANITLGSGCGNTHTVLFLQDGLLEGVHIEAVKLGETLPISDYSQRTADFDCSVLVGKIDEPHIEALLKEHKTKVDIGWLGEQGYQVVVIPGNTSKKVIVVTGATEIGTLYGLIGLRLRMYGEGVKTLSDWSTSYRDRPIFKFRQGKGWFRGNMELCHATREVKKLNIFRYEDFQEIFPSEGFKKEYLGKVKELEAQVHRQLQEAEQYGSKVFFFTYQPKVPKWGQETFFKAHPEAIPLKQSAIKCWICPSAEISKKFTYSKWHCLFKRFPTAAGVILTISASDGGGLYCDCENCKNYPIRQRVIDYILLIRRAIQSVNPKAIVILRPWRLPTSFEKLAKDLPEDVYYTSKLTSPPANDVAWADNFCKYLETMPRFIVSGTCGYNTEGGPGKFPYLCYTGPKQKERAIKLAEKGGLGAWAEPSDPYKSPTKLWDILRLPSQAARTECGWDPYAFDPNEYLHRWAINRYGREVGLRLYNALRETKLIADSFIIEPLKTNTYQMYVYPDCGGAGYGGAYYIPEELKQAKPEDVERFKKRFDNRHSIEIALTAQSELTEAVKLVPENNEIHTFLTMANITAELTQMWQDYHLSLLYKCVESNVSDPVAKAHFDTLARQYAQAAYKRLPRYLENYLKIYPHLIDGPHYYKHPGLYNAFITQQVNNAYHQAVMRPEQEKLFPVVRSRLTAKHTEIKDRAFVTDITKSDACILKMLSREGPSSTELNFSGDLSQGGMLYLIYYPYAERTQQNRYTGACAYLDVQLDGRKIGQIQDFMTAHSCCRLKRCLKLPPCKGTSHSLKITLTKGIAVKFERFYIYGPEGADIITPLPEVVCYKEDFSKPVKWDFTGNDDALCKARYNHETRVSEVSVYRSNAKGVVYMNLPSLYNIGFTFECDLTWKQIPKKASGAFKLFGGKDPEQWVLTPTYTSGHSERYGSVREGHYGFYMKRGKEVTVRLSFFVVDPFRGMLPRRGSKGPEVELKVGEKYHFKLARFAETARFTITNPEGRIVMDTPMDVSVLQDFTINKVGFQNNFSRHSIKSPVIVLVDNIYIGASNAKDEK